jgi:hypothetical protein
MIYCNNSTPWHLVIMLVSPTRIILSVSIHTFVSRGARYMYSVIQVMAIDPTPTLDNQILSLGIVDRSYRHRSSSPSTPVSTPVLGESTSYLHDVTRDILRCIFRRGSHRYHRFECERRLKRSISIYCKRLSPQRQHIQNEEPSVCRLLVPFNTVHFTSPILACFFIASTPQECRSLQGRIDNRRIICTDLGICTM